MDVGSYLSPRLSPHVSQSVCFPTATHLFSLFHKGYSGIMLFLKKKKKNVLITLPSHMLKVKPPYTILRRVCIVFILKYLSHTFTRASWDGEWRHFYQQLLWNSTPNSHFDTLSPWRRWQQQVCVCVCVWFQMSKWPFNVCMFERGRGISRDKRWCCW